MPPRPISRSIVAADDLDLAGAVRHGQRRGAGLHGLSQAVGGDVGGAEHAAQLGHQPRLAVELVQPSLLRLGVQGVQLDEQRLQALPPLR